MRRNNPGVSPEPGVGEYWGSECPQALPASVDPGQRPSGTPSTLQNWELQEDSEKHWCSHLCAGSVSTSGTWGPPSGSPSPCV